MKPRHLTFIAALAASGCSPESAPPTEADVLEVQVLPAPNICRVRGIAVACSDLPAYLLQLQGVSSDAPVALQWEGGVMPNETQLSALALSLKQAGFKTVGFVSIARYDSASSHRDR
jgi:hypothetical protein